MFKGPVRRWAAVPRSRASVVLVTLLAASALASDVPFPQASPEELGLLLPVATPKPGVDRRIIVQVDDKPVVGIVHVEVGNRFVVLLPDGHLVSVPIAETTSTDRPFEAVTKQQLAEDLTSGRFQGFKTRTTRRYLYVYNTSEPFARATSRILETMYPGLFNYCRRQKIPVRDPRFPLVVVMFKTQDEFEKYRKMPPGLVAYYNGLSNHVVLYEQSRLANIAPDLAFKQSISTIAHEGVHQVLHNIGVQQRLSKWPLWFSEGLAEYFAPTELGRRVRWKGVGFVNDLRLYELSEYVKKNRDNITNGQLVRRTTEAASLDSLGYATAWAMISYLAKNRRGEFEDYLRHISQLGPLETAEPGSLFVEYFGSDYSAVETKLFKHLSKMDYVDPIANQTHFVLIIGRQRPEIIITSSPQKLQQLQRKRVKGKAYQIRAFPNRTTAQEFSRRLRAGR